MDFEVQVASQSYYNILGLSKSSSNEEIRRAYRKLAMVCEVDVGEAMALRYALKIAIEASLLNVICETDSLKVYYHLKKQRCELSYFGNVIRDILELAKQCNYISYSHVRRSGNVVAHEMAKLASEYEDLRVWIEEIPPSVYAFVQADCLDPT